MSGITADDGLRKADCRITCRLNAQQKTPIFYYFFHTCHFFNAPPFPSDHTKQLAIFADSRAVFGSAYLVSPFLNLYKTMASPERRSGKRQSKSCSPVPNLDSADNLPDSTRFLVPTPIFPSAISRRCIEERSKSSPPRSPHPMQSARRASTPLGTTANSDGTGNGAPGLGTSGEDGDADWLLLRRHMQAYVLHRYLS